MSNEESAIGIDALRDVSNRVVIITGSGQGIGRTLAKAFGAAGACVVVAEINEEKACAVAAEVSASGARALAIQTDVSDVRSVQEMVDRTQREFGRVDVLINNAGIFSTLKMRPFDEIPMDEWDRVMRVNVTGVMLCCRAVVPAMRSAQWGRIVNISSGSVSLGRPNYLHYTTSKSALIGMTRSLARELGSCGITVNALLPGAVFTEIPRETVTAPQKEMIIKMQCIPRAQAPEDLIGTVLHLSSPASAFMTGQSLTVDGGATHS
jgi:NAD(P)-dependent dehydrogenase (short-subunit alcohol dehydrogenase family)